MRRKTAYNIGMLPVVGVPPGCDLFYASEVTND